MKKLLPNCLTERIRFFFCAFPGVTSETPEQEADVLQEMDERFLHHITDITYYLLSFRAMPSTGSNAYL